MCTYLSCHDIITSEATLTKLIIAQADLTMQQRWHTD